MAQKPKLDIFKMLKSIDSKDYSFYDNLTDSEISGFSAFLGLKWGSSVSSNNTTQHYYLASINHYSNMHLFDINKHPKLQWLTLVASSPNIGVQRHEWLGTKKSTTNKSKKIVKKRLMEIYPTYKENDIDVLSTMITNKDLKQYDKESGNY